MQVLQQKIPGPSLSHPDSWGCPWQHLGTRREQVPLMFLKEGITFFFLNLSEVERNFPEQFVKSLTRTSLRKGVEVL